MNINLFIRQTVKELKNVLIFVFLILLMFQFLNSIDLWAATRGKISGKIIDSQTKEPLPGVNVVVEGTHMGAASDEKGDFFIANIPVGTYTLTASMIGYREMTVKNVRVRINGTTEINFMLTPEAIEGEEVVVVAERPPVELDNTSSAMILGTREIEDQPTTVFTEVLTTLPSINTEGGEIKFRGGTLDEVAFIVDGARLRNPLDHTPYTDINLSSVQEVEVVTGAFNAEYGEAQSGVINIITKEGSDQYELFLDTRYTPPGKRHWGLELYDRSTDLYWENTHARHLDWWIENTDNWVDPNGNYGYEADCQWTPEEAYQNYLDTHQPLTDYTNTPSYQTELSFGGPFPFLRNTTFYFTGKYRSQAPLFGNSYLDRGRFYDGTLKFSYKINPDMKLILSGLYSTEKTAWGIEGPPDYFYAHGFGISSRYAYYDYPGLPESSTNSQTIIFSHVLNASTLYELRLSRINANRKTDVFPDDPIGWEATEATRDNLRAVDSLGNPITGGYKNSLGYHTTGYFYRYDDQNTEWNFTGFLGSQISKRWYVKAGFEFTYYILDHFNQSKLPDRRDDNIYKPYQGAFYAQNKLEFGGFIMNAGLRLDFYNPNDVIYSNLFDPLNSETEKTKIFTQLSPRLGVSHPIDAKTVLHFSYGHFFQRASFGDYGEGTGGGEGSLTTFIVDGTNFPWVLGNRELEPQKTVAYEVGIERNIANFFVLDLTAYYKDIRNTVRVTTIESPFGVYATNSNGNYADVRGAEISLNKLPSRTPIGTIWGYANFTTQTGIDGKSGDPVLISYDGSVRYGGSGDVILHNNPRLKVGLFYKTPGKLNWLAGLFQNITFSLDYQVTYPNEMLRPDYFLYGGKKYLRPADKNANLRIRKDIKIFGTGMVLSPYFEIHNLFNDKWLYLQAFESASVEDQRKFAESGFKYIPSKTATGVTILDMGKYRNLPRSILFGMSIEFN